MEPILLTAAVLWALNRTESGVMTTTETNAASRSLVLAEPLPGDVMILDPQDAYAWGY